MINGVLAECYLGLPSSTVKHLSSMTTVSPVQWRLRAWTRGDIPEIKSPKSLLFQCNQWPSLIYYQISLINITPITSNQDSVCLGPWNWLKHQEVDGATVSLNSKQKTIIWTISWCTIGNWSGEFKALIYHWLILPTYSILLHLEEGIMSPDTLFRKGWTHQAHLQFSLLSLIFPLVAWLASFNTSSVCNVCRLSCVTLLVLSGVWSLIQDHRLSLQADMMFAGLYQEWWGCYELQLKGRFRLFSHSLNNLWSFGV